MLNGILGAEGESGKFDSKIETFLKVYLNISQSNNHSNGTVILSEHTGTVSQHSN
jgi:hypothetical protein